MLISREENQPETEPSERKEPKQKGNEASEAEFLGECYFLVGKLRGRKSITGLQDRSTHLSSTTPSVLEVANMSSDV